MTALRGRGRGRAMLLWLAALAAAIAAALVAVPSRAQVLEQITIKRDRYGVPHVSADSREAVSYGAGYALAQDRLWQMHVFRNVAKGKLSDIFGPEVADTDKAVRFFTYTDQERARRYQTYPEDQRRDLEAFVAGVNAWIDKVNGDPSKMPFEFLEYGVQPIPHWTVDDSVALGDVLILAFGSGGGEELQNAALLSALQERLGPEKARTAFDDLVRTDDPDSPVSIERGFRWQDSPTHADESVVDAARALEEDARLSLDSGGGSSGGGAGAAIGTSAQEDLAADPGAALRQADPIERGLKQLRAAFHFGSNAQIVGPGLAENGNSLQTGGPQVGYLVPQWVADIGMHGGGFDVTGMTFAGVGPAVLIGRGKGYAWTTTTGSSDLTDTYVEHLNPGNSHEYLYNGQYEPMDCRQETYTTRGVPYDRQEICRTRHGPVLAFDKDKDLAYSLRYAWFNREGQTVDGFFRFNRVQDLAGYATAAELLASNHNMFYVDDGGHFGYWHPGNHVARQDGVDLRLPQDGGGGSEWKGLLPIQQVPHAVDSPRPWLVNWNNQPAEGWERERAWNARDNVINLMEAYSDGRVADPDGGSVNPDGRWDFQDLNANLRRAAFADHFYTYFRSSFPAADALGSDLSRRALDVLRSWDGFLVDRNGDGKYDSAGVTILHRWLSRLRDDVFKDDLGDQDGFARIDTELWHVISPDSTLRYGYDWLNGQSRDEAAARAFDRAVSELASDFGNDDPASWRSDAEMEHYQRLNSDLPEDLAATTSCDASNQVFGRCFYDPGKDSGFPGDVPDHIAMDRGTYNHIVSYLDPPQPGATLGASSASAGSVIPPGQSGFVSPTGQEDRHFEDQLPLYVNWRYKPMPLADQVAGETESTETIGYSP